MNNKMRLTFKCLPEMEAQAAELRGLGSSKPPYTAGKKEQKRDEKHELEARRRCLSFGN
ncbi:hypothetical protein BDZ89DRAFT_1066795, partial [Hymenopellis radicata]